MPAPATVVFVIVSTFASFPEFLQLLVIAGDADCPLDLSWSNFTWASSACSSQNERAKCCRYLNAFVTVSVAHYANKTGNLGVPSELNDACISYVSQTFVSYGIPHSAALFCGVGPKIHVYYQCQGMTSQSDFQQSHDFEEVDRNCKMPLTTENGCRKCLNSSISYLHHLIGPQDNVTLNTCRDVAFVALAMQGDSNSAIDLASCFFSIRELQTLPVNAPQPSTQQISTESPASSPTMLSTEAPLQQLTGFHLKEHHNSLGLPLLPRIGIIVTGLAILLVIVLILLIRKTSRELKRAEATNPNLCNVLQRSNDRKYKGPSSTFQRFSYNKIKKATNNFQNIIGRAGFGTIYKAQFNCGTIAAVKLMHQVVGYRKEEFRQEMEFLSRLHHRHLVALKGFCVERCERYLIYEYMENGSLKDHLHSSDKIPLNWQMRIQIAIDVANALEYLHFYCEPRLCHRDIKASNVLLDNNFLAKVANFGLVHASTRDESVGTPVSLYIYGTPGYIDPEYAVTRELTEKSDVYSYGVLLLELVTGRHAIHENVNLIEWSEQFTAIDSKLPGLVDPKLGDAFDVDQLQVVVGIVKWCTQKERCLRPSMKQVLWLLHENLDPLQAGFVKAMEDGGRFVNRRIVLQSSSSTSRSYCSRNALLESSSPQSPTGINST